MPNLVFDNQNFSCDKCVFDPKLLIIRWRTQYTFHQKRTAIKVINRVTEMMCLGILTIFYHGKYQEYTKHQTNCPRVAPCHHSWEQSMTLSFSDVLSDRARPHNHNATSFTLFTYGNCDPDSSFGKLFFSYDVFLGIMLK